ncbi:MULTISPECIES: JAB domain-containing protein [Christiangramia]|uniref:JAB domain-containing protein n=1 Tax=Christiangramia TaxID=292691 RepID=UPI0009FA37B4|nr:JAB domain-containing protein [Christiangramia flava]OSS37658.1 DNA repair protein RadC [Christiangramia flava JLT2011]
MKTKVNEISIRYREKLSMKEAPKITSSQSASDLFYQNWDIDQLYLQESFKVMLLNNANRVKGIFEVSKGGITGTLVDVRIIFGVALKSMTTAMILAHNHPSGTLKPSMPDRTLTVKIQKAAEFLDIKLLDHLIISPYSEYFSFADEGIL